MKNKRWALIVALFAIAIPLFAIVSGQTLTNKLKDLCTELRMTTQQRSKAQQRFDEDYERQHQKMLDVINKSNDLSILLYTQEQNMTFDLTYALKKVSSEYKDFSKDPAPIRPHRKRTEHRNRRKSRSRLPISSSRYPVTLRSWTDRATWKSRGRIFLFCNRVQWRIGFGNYLRPSSTSPS